MSIHPTTTAVPNCDLTLTPTQELVLEVLAARWRLGEHIWTFSSRSARAARALEKRGLVFLMPGIRERTYRAGLTDVGRQEALTDRYLFPPHRHDGVGPCPVKRRSRADAKPDINRTVTRMDATT